MCVTATKQTDNNQAFSVRAFITCVYNWCWLVHLYILPLSKLTANLHFLCQEFTLKLVLDNVTRDINDHMLCIYCWPLYFFLCWVQPLSCWTASSSSFTCCVFVSDPLSAFDPEIFCGTFTPLPLPPSDSLTVPSPSSACVRSSMSEYLRHQQHLVSRLECLLNDTSFTPFSPHLPPPESPHSN